MPVRMLLSGTLYTAPTSHLISRPAHAGSTARRSDAAANQCPEDHSKRSGGAICMAGTSLAADAAGPIYFLAGSGTWPPSGDDDFGVRSRGSGTDRVDDGFGCGPDTRPTRRAENHNRDTSGGEVLLVLEIGVRGHLYLKPLTFGGGEYLAVRECGPAALTMRWAPDDPATRGAAAPECLDQRGCALTPWLGRCERRAPARREPAQG